VYHFKQTIILGIATIFLVGSGVWIMTIAGQIWDDQMAAIDASVDHVAETANAHSGQGLLGGLLFFIGLVCVASGLFLAKEAHKYATDPLVAER